MSDQTTPGRKGSWRLTKTPRRWQTEALFSWTGEFRGVVSVVTAAGKTFYAMQCMVAARKRFPDCRFLIVVPTVALMDHLIQLFGQLSDQVGPINRRPRSTRGLASMVRRPVLGSLNQRSKLFLECLVTVGTAERTALTKLAERNTTGRATPFRG